MSELSDREVNRVFQALPPQARFVINTMSEAQKRPVEDVLRDEIREYIAGRLPAIDLDGAMRTVRTTAYDAGYMLGRLRRFARDWAGDE